MGFGRRPESAVDSHKEVVHHANPDCDSHKEALPSTRHLLPEHEGIEAIYPGSRVKELPAAQSDHGRTGRTICGIRPVWFWSLLGVVVLLIIGAAFGGSVGATHAKSVSSESSPSTSSPSSLPASATSAASASPPTNPAQIRSNTKLAAVNYTDSSNVMQYRVYHQSEDSMIRGSAWNDTGESWYVTNATIGKAKPGSPVAAAGTGPPNHPIVSFSWQDTHKSIYFNRCDTQHTTVYYLDDSDVIHERYTMDQITWSDGNLGTQNLTADSNSNLATIWHRHDGCQGCPDTLLFIWQDSTKKLQLGNGTTTGWEFYTLSANPVFGSGLSLALLWNASWPTSVRLYYQIANGVSNGGDLTYLDWSSPEQWSAQGRM